MRDRRHIAEWLACAALLLVAAKGAAALAQEAPAPRVARLTYAEGYVRIDHHDNTAGDPAQRNMPLVEGQTVITGEDGQAEIEFEDGSLARVTPNSALLLSHLTIDSSGDASTQLGLLKGLAYFELRAAPQFAYRVDAGGDQITPAENTTLRVNLDEPPAAIAVLDGTSHVERPGGYRTDIHAGETLRGDTATADRYFLTQEIAPDSWDQWNESRDQAAADSASVQTAARDGYAGSQGYGWSDLDANGSWYDVPVRDRSGNPPVAMPPTSTPTATEAGSTTPAAATSGPLPTPGAGRPSAAAAGPTGIPSAGAGRRTQAVAASAS